MAIETTTEEDTEMARTRKTDETTENIVPLRPEADEQPQVDEQPDELVQSDSDQQAEPDEPPETQSRSRGPALNRVELIGRIAKGPELRGDHLLAPRSGLTESCLHLSLCWRQWARTWPAQIDRRPAVR